MEAVVMPWPGDENHRTALSVAGVPRLLVLAAGSAPPPPLDCLEDWVADSASADELAARREGIAARLAVHGTDVGAAATATVPDLDGDGVLRHGGVWVALPPIEARLVGTLLDRLGSVVSRESLVQAGWPASRPARNALDVHVLRLRRRIAPVGLAIRTIRSRGYLLEA